MFPHSAHNIKQLRGGTWGEIIPGEGGGTAVFTGLVGKRRNRGKLEETLRAHKTPKLVWLGWYCSQVTIWKLPGDGWSFSSSAWDILKQYPAFSASPKSSLKHRHEWNQELSISPRNFQTASADVYIFTPQQEDAAYQFQKFHHFISMWNLILCSFLRAVSRLT